MKARSVGILWVVFLFAAAAAQSGEGAPGSAGGQGGTPATQGAQARANTSAQATAEAPGVPSDTKIAALLTKSVDAKKAKPGDPVEAKTSEKLQLSNGASLPKGTKLIGHVTQAKAKDKGESQSLLGIMFDKAVLKGGQEVPMHAIIQAAAAAQQPSSLPDTMVSAGSGAAAGGPGGPYGGAQGAGAPAGPGGASATMGAPAGPPTGVGESPVGSQGAPQGGIRQPGMGVSGIPGVALSPELSNTTSGSVFVSNTRSVKLDSGTELVLRTIPQ